MSPTTNNFDFRHWLFPLALILTSVANTFFRDYTEQLFRYDRLLILDGQFWRIFTAHLLHITWSHLFMNLAGLLFIFYFFGNLLSTRTWIAIFILCSFFVSITILYTMPEMRWYVGMSGVLHGLFLAGGIADIKIRPTEAYLFLAFIIGKLLYEQVVGPLPGSEESAGGPVLVDAHLYGAIYGAFFTLIILNLKKQKQKSSR